MDGVHFAPLRYCRQTREPRQYGQNASLRRGIPVIGSEEHVEERKQLPVDNTGNTRSFLDRLFNVSSFTQSMITTAAMVSLAILILSVVFTIIFLIYPQNFGNMSLTGKSPHSNESLAMSSMPTGAWRLYANGHLRKPTTRDTCSATCIAGVSVATYYGKYCGYGYTGCPGAMPCDALDSCCYAHDMCCVYSSSLIDCGCTYALRQCALCAAAAENISMTDAESAQQRGFGANAPSTRKFALEVASVMSWILQEFCNR